MALLEKEIQAQIIEYLKLKRIFFWRNNIGAGQLKGGRFVRFGVPGAPDLFVLKEGKLIGIEVKRAKTKLSPLQEEFGAEMQKNGATYIVARDLDDVMAVL